MNRFLIVTVSLIIMVTNMKLTIDDNQIIGKWQNPDKNRHIEIYKQRNLFFGKIIWLKDAKDEKVKKGDVVLKDIVFRENMWFGKIKIPARDDNFDVEMTITDSNKLIIKAKYGLVSRVKVWTRLN